MDDKLRLELRITSMILEVVDMHDQVDTSDIQSIAQVKARDIIKEVRKNGH